MATPKIKNTAITLTTNTYAGELYAGYNSKALLPEEGLVNRGLVTVKEAIKDKVIMRKAEQALVFQTPSAAFTPETPTLTLSEQSFSVVPYEVQAQIEEETLRTTWESQNLGRGSFADYLGTQELSNYLLSDIWVPQLGRMNEQLYILGKGGVDIKGGSATFSAEYKGLLQKFEDGTGDQLVNKYSLSGVDSAVRTITAITTGAIGTASITVDSTTGIKVGDDLTILGADGNQQIGGVTINGQTVTVTSVVSSTVVLVNKVITGATPATTGTVQFINQGNVLDVLNYNYAIMPEVVRRNPSARMLISSKTEKAYRQANAGVSQNSADYFRGDYFGQNDIPFLDMKMVSMPYWKPNTVATWAKENVFLGIDLLSDDVNIKVIYQGEYTLDEFYRMRNRMKSQVDFLYGEEIVLTRPA